MRVRLDRFQSLHGGARFRALLLLGFGALGVVVASFLALVGVVMAFMPDGGIWERRGGVAFSIFGGVFPLLGAVAMLWRGAVGRQRLHRLRDLAAFARVRPSFHSQELATALTLLLFPAVYGMDFSRRRRRQSGEGRA